MANEREIEGYRKAYAECTDAQLINHTHQWNPSCAQHIAAQQLLAERREQKAEERHQKIEGRLDELKRPHWTVLPNFWLIALSAVAAVVAAYFAWLALRK